MALRLRAIRLHVTTAAGPYGLDLRFGGGLNVIRADNSSGKSTAMQGIIFALGLEGMLTASRAVPLPPVMTDALFDANMHEISVLESYVLLEVENAAGAPLTIQRWAKHGTIRPDLIATWAAPLITAPGSKAEQRDFFVRERGAAQHEAGFHSFLAGFLGWELPMVNRSDGTAVPLYLECIFPALMVEQKRGWGGVLQHMPYYLRIPEMAKRAVEFILALEAYDISRRRREIEHRESELRKGWAIALSDLNAISRTASARVVGVPESPSVSWPPVGAPRIVVAEGNGWVPLDEAIAAVRTQLATLPDVAPSVDSGAHELTARLAEGETQLGQLQAGGMAVLDEINLDQSQLAAADARITALTQDLQRYQDIRVLRRLGSSMDIETSREECPTCHQDLPPALVDLVAPAQAMSVEDNTTFVAEQLETFKAMRDAVAADLRAKEARLAAVRTAADELRKELRTIRSTLAAPGQLPSAAAIERRIRLQDRLERLASMTQTLLAVLSTFSELSGQWRKVAAERDRLRGVELSESDIEKLDSLQQLFREQLRAYGFTSLSVDDLAISRLKYTPEHQGFDLGSDISASDMIRAIWAYLLSVMELSRIRETNHPGLLVVDEPRQQDTDPRSYAVFLRRAARSIEFGQQVVCATSESDQNVREWLTNIPHTYLSFEGKLIRPAPASV